MSTLVVSNISDGTTTVGASYVTNGSAKAWCRTFGTGSPFIVVSFNISSLTDNGTGDQTFTYTSAFSEAAASLGNPQTNAFAAGAAQVLTPATSSVRLKTHDHASASSDDEGKHVACQGDLA